MNISMYQASTPRFVNALKNLSAILDKAQAHAEANKIEPTVLTNCRLFPNMFPMKRQVQIEDNEETFAELKARIAKTVDFIQSIKPAQVDGSEEKNIHLKLGPREVDYKGMQYLLGHAIPNFYFHVTTAYDILRHNGVELAKRDYLANP